MKANRQIWILLLLLSIATAFRLLAQQTDVDHKFFEETKAKAEKGDAFAQSILGGCYLNGEGVAKDAVEAVKWWRKAAARNNASAQLELGVCYANGFGVVKDEVEAMKWWRQAAEQNDAKAQFNLGVFYAFGRGVAEDYGEAVKWYRKAAEAGNASAQCRLATCYANGKGIAKDLVKAAKWWRKAAKRGDAEAQVCLGGCYASGDGVSIDFIEAVKWYQKAADQGCAVAQGLLGCYYYLGKGVSTDYIQAYKWISLASAQGDDGAGKVLGNVKRQITSEQVVEAQRLAREFTPHKQTSPDTSSENSTASGTGFFITDDGFLITNDHVVEGADQLRLVTSAGIISAKVVRVDSANDLALLKADGKYSPLPLATSRGVKLGGTVATVGFPNIGLQGFAPKLAKGEIASLSGAGDDARYFQISVPVQPGNSGGALVDERGNVVGVVSAKLSAKAALAASGALPENVNYAVKSSFLLSFLESVPEVSAKLKEPNTKAAAFEDVVKSAQDAAVLVLVY